MLLLEAHVIVFICEMKKKKNERKKNNENTLYEWSEAKKK